MKVNYTESSRTPDGKIITHTSSSDNQQSLSPPDAIKWCREETHILGTLECILPGASTGTGERVQVETDEPSTPKLKITIDWTKKCYCIVVGSEGTGSDESTLNADAKCDEDGKRNFDWSKKEYIFNCIGTEEIIDYGSGVDNPPSVPMRVVYNCFCSYKPPVTEGPPPETPQSNTCEGKIEEEIDLHSVFTVADNWYRKDKPDAETPTEWHHDHPWQEIDSDMEAALDECEVPSYQHTGKGITAWQVMNQEQAHCLNMMLCCGNENQATANAAVNKLMTNISGSVGKGWQKLRRSGCVKAGYTFAPGA